MANPTKPPHEQTTKPNIVFILVDNVGWGDFAAKVNCRNQAITVTDPMMSEMGMFRQSSRGPGLKSLQGHQIYNFRSRIVPSVLISYSFLSFVATNSG